MKNKIATACFILLFTSLYCTADSYNENKYQDYYNNAVTLFKANKYSSAIQEFRKVLRVKPYDNVVKNALVTAYLARAQYYTNQQNQTGKAAVDLKNALFYLKYWNSENISAKEAATINSVQNSLKEIEKNSLTPAQRFEKARILRTQGELAASAYEYAQLTHDKTYSTKAYENMADIYKTLNDELDAINSYRAAIKQEPKNALLHFKYAVLLEDIGNLDASNDEYNAALKLGENNVELLNRLEELWLSRTIENPKDASALINLGTVLQKKGDNAQAKNQYIKAMAIDPNDETANMNLASVYVSENNYQEAVNIYDNMLSKKPKDVNLLLYRGVAWEKLNNYQNAFKDYSVVLSIDPNNKVAKEAVDDIARNKFTGEQLYSYYETVANTRPEDFNAQYDCAYQLHKGHEINRAIQYYKRALAINPKSAESYINLAQIYLEQKNQAEYNNIIAIGLQNVPNNKALTELKSEVDKEASANMYNDALSYWNNKKYKEALNVFLKIPYQTPEVISSISSCYFELQDYQKSLEYANKFLSKEPNNKDMLYMAANANLELGRSDEAEKYFNSILQLDPNNQDVKNAITYLKQSKTTQKLNDAIKAYEAKDYHNAILLLDEVTKQDSKNAYAYYYKGLIYQEQNKKPEALVQFQRVVNYDPKFTMGYYSLGLALDEQERYKDAVNCYDRYLELKKEEGTLNDEYGKYAAARTQELKEYLNSNGQEN